MSNNDNNVIIIFIIVVWMAARPGSTAAVVRVQKPRGLGGGEKTKTDKYYKTNSASIYYVYR